LSVLLPSADTADSSVLVSGIPFTRDNTRECDRTRPAVNGGNPY